MDLATLFVLLLALGAVGWAVSRLIAPVTRIADSLETIVDLLKGEDPAGERLRDAAADAAQPTREPQDRVEWRNASRGAGLKDKP